jgi:hypothetical protein
MVSNSDLWFADQGATRRKDKVIVERERRLHRMIKRARILGGDILKEGYRYGVVAEEIGQSRKVSNGIKSKLSIIGIQPDIIMVRNQEVMNRYLVARVDGYQPWPYYIDPPAEKDIRVLAVCEKAEEKDYLWRNVPYSFDPKMESLRSRILDVRMFPIVGDIGLYMPTGYSRFGLSTIRFAISGKSFDFSLYVGDKRPQYAALARFIENALDDFCESWP